ncbi:MAG: porin family protein [Vicingaceae bacterium]|nr:porin family protein [Vicingaceae bacterium]
MKKLKKVTFLLLVTVIPLIGKSQIKVSVGSEVTSALDDFSHYVSYGFGLSGGAEYNFTDKFGITAQLGYIYLIPEADYASAFMVPMQGGLKFYIESKENGAYISPIIGAHKLSITTKDYVFQGQIIPRKTVAKTNVSYGFGMGYLFRAKFDVSVRYNLITDDDDDNTSSYFGLRLALEF